MDEPTQTEPSRAERLRAITTETMGALAALVPFVLGTGEDSHGNPLPDRSGTLDRALATLERIGQQAAELRVAPTGRAPKVPTE
jgi:hypothetical protein